MSYNVGSCIFSSPDRRRRARPRRAAGSGAGSATCGGERCQARGEQRLEEHDRWRQTRPRRTEGSDRQHRARPTASAARARGQRQARRGLVVFPRVQFVILVLCVRSVLVPVCVYIASAFSVLMSDDAAKSQSFRISSGVRY